MITEQNTIVAQRDQQDQRDLRNSFHRTRIFKGIKFLNYVLSDVR